MNDCSTSFEHSSGRDLVSFDRFQAGDLAMFDRTFSQDEFGAFSVLSGDRNPLHHDAEYAASTRFARPIVPLHMTLAPLSAVAGMIFPGKPSLYLGHEVRAAKPVMYGETIRYSARVEAVNIAHRILTIRVLAIRETEVVLDTLMRVQAIQEEWEGQPAFPIISTRGPGRALVTGASGGIGRATALALNAAGWSLLLQDRGADERRASLAEALERNSASFEFITADLSTRDGQKTVSEAARGRDDLEVVVHSASANVEAPLADLVETNYVALRTIAEAVLPNMLARQKGRLLYVSSVMIRGVPGWEDYVAAKTMATGYVGAIEKRLATYGVRGLSILPGLVETPFSEEFRGGAPALLPQEVAETIVEMVDRPVASAVVLEVGRRLDGSFGVHFETPPPAATQSGSPCDDMVPEKPHSVSLAEPIADLVRRKLRLPQSTDLSSGGLGVTPGWDSLSQIELVLEIESQFGISFSSAEIESLTQYPALAAATARKLQAQ